MMGQGASRAMGCTHPTLANSISVVLPCHRIIGAEGKLIGYGGGLARKRWLLKHAGVAFQDKPITRGGAVWPN